MDVAAASVARSPSEIPANSGTFAKMSVALMTAVAPCCRSSRTPLASRPRRALDRRKRLLASHGAGRALREYAALLERGKRRGRREARRQLPALRHERRQTLQDASQLGARDRRLGAHAVTLAGHLEEAEADRPHERRALGTAHSVHGHLGGGG